MDEQRIKEIVCIDFGSTNSQMGHKYVDCKTGKAIDWNDEDYTKNLINDIPENKNDTNIPTVLLKWVGSENGKPYWDRDIPAGKAVDSLSREQFKEDIEIIREFKKDLYYSNEEKRSDPQKAKKYEEACANVKEFFKFLKEIKYNNVAKTLIPNETETIITLPARSTNEDMDIIKRLASEAGWENITTRDEARSALDYAVYKPDSELMKGIKNSTVTQCVHVLLIDIGGSTTDILHAEIKPDGNGSYESDYKSFWPKQAESDTLGGIDIDKKIAELLIKRKHVVKGLAEEEIDKHGYMKFRKFKEAWSNQVDKPASELMGMDDLVCDFKARKFAECIYDDLSEGEKLNRKDFEEIIEEYIVKLQKAIRSVLKHDDVKEQDIDYIVLAGGGSLMYGIDEMILGKFNVSEPLDFAKIKKNPAALIHGEKKNPSAVCCFGNLFDKTDIICRNHINDNYSAEMEVYTNDAKVLFYYDGMGEKSKDGKAALPQHSKYQYTLKFDIAKDMEPLPLSKTSTFDKKIQIVSGENMLFRITVYRQSSDSENKNIECSWLYKSERNISKWVADGVRNFLFGAQSNTIPLSISVHREIDENRKISIATNYSAEGFCSNEKTTKI